MTLPKKQDFATYTCDIKQENGVVVYMKYIPPFPKKAIYPELKTETVITLTLNIYHTIPSR